MDLSSFLNVYLLRKLNLFGRNVGSDTDRVIGAAITNILHDAAFTEHVTPIPYSTLLLLVKYQSQLAFSFVKEVVYSFFKPQHAYEETLQMGKWEIN